MPRTDLGTTYINFVKDDLKETLECYSLYEIVKELARYTGNGSKDLVLNYQDDKLDENQFVWKNGDKQTTITVRYWLNTL